MRIHRVEINNFRSFDEFCWEGLSSGLNVVVGPNGTGKTNLVHALRAVVDILDIQGYARRDLIQMSTHRGLRDRPIKFVLDLEFDDLTEIELIQTFVAAALCESDGGSYEGMPRVSQLLNEYARDIDVSLLLKGRLTAQCDSLGKWSSWYESRVDKFGWSWGLEDADQHQIVGENPTANAQSGYDSLMSSYMGEPMRVMGDPMYKIECPGDRPIFDDYINGATKKPRIPELRAVIHGNRTKLEVKGQNAEQLPTHTEFARLVGLGRGEWYNKSYTGRSLLHLLLSRALVFTDNVRRSSRSIFTVEEMKAPAANLSNGESLSLHLFQMKNGSQPDRQRYDSVQSLLNNLIRRKFDVALLGTTENTQEGKLSLALRIVEDWDDVSLEYSGAGRAEALFLSSVIAGTKGKVVLLDEPAQNLHPVVQSTLLRELLLVTSNQFIMVTHSPHLMPAEGLSHVTRFSASRYGATQHASLSGFKVDDDTMADIERRLRGSTDLRALLFGHGVVLVEGETEKEALRVWSDQLPEDAPDRLDITFFDVGGHHNFKTYVNIVEHFHLPWAIVCDGEIIGPASGISKSKFVDNQLTRAGVTGIPDLSDEDFSRRKEILQGFGVFSLAESVNESFENVPGISEHLPEARRNQPRSKVRYGRHIALKHSTPQRVIELLQKVEQWLLR